MGRRPSKWMGYTTRLYPTFRGSARHMVSDDRRTLSRAYPTALGTNRWVFSASDHTGDILGSTYHAVHFSFEPATHDLHVTRIEGPDGMAESAAPNGSSPFPSIEPAPERGIPSGRAILNLGLMNGGCSPRWGRFVPWLGLLQPRMDKRRCWLGDIMGRVRRSMLLGPCLGGELE